MLAKAIYLILNAFLVLVKKFILHVIKSLSKAFLEAFVRFLLLLIARYYKLCSLRLCQNVEFFIIKLVTQGFVNFFPCNTLNFSCALVLDAFLVCLV